MLIDKPLSAGEVVSIRLISGEEIIARLEEETTEHVKVNRPLAVNLSSQGLGMIPFIFLGNKEIIKLKQSHIIAICPSKKEAADQYLQGTTGIAMTR